MDVSEFVVRIALLSLPGILASKIYRKLRGRTEKKPWEDFLEILLFSAPSYVFSFWISHLFYTGAELREPATQIASVRPLGETAGPIVVIMVVACLVGAILAVLAAYVHSSSLVNRLGHMIGVTKRSGDEDVRQTFFDMPQTVWVTVRDHTRALTYFGFLRYYSDSGQDRELSLENVDVFRNEDGQKMYSCAAMYVCRPAHELTIEVPIELIQSDAGVSGRKETTDGSEKS